MELRLARSSDAALLRRDTVSLISHIICKPKKQKVLLPCGTEFGMHVLLGIGCIVGVAS